MIRIAAAPASDSSILSQRIRGAHRCTIAVSVIMRKPAIPNAGWTSKPGWTRISVMPASPTVARVIAAVRRARRMWSSLSIATVPSSRAMAPSSVRRVYYSILMAIPGPVFYTENPKRLFRLLSRRPLLLGLVARAGDRRPGALAAQQRRQRDVDDVLGQLSELAGIAAQDVVVQQLEHA